MIKFKQTVGYIDFFEHFLRNLARYRTDTWTIAMLLLYGACFAGLLLYCGMCIRAMYLNYKDYEKSKILAMICLFLTLIISYIAIKSSLYKKGEDFLDTKTPRFHALEFFVAR